MKFKKIHLSPIFVVAYVLFTFTSLFAANIYVDNGTIEVGAAWDGINGHTYICSHGTGTGYSTSQAGIAAMNSGDDVYIRTGTYKGYNPLYSTADGSPQNWSTIQSYPGEWAILDANGAKAALGNSSCYDKVRTASCMREYWRIERLELTGGIQAGIFISGGPIEVRYCYIHDNLASVGGANPCGIKGMIWKDCIVEYCHFNNNGVSTSVDEMHSAIGMQIHSDYCYNDPEVGPCVIDNAMQNNTYRYNLFQNTDSRARGGIHGKARQYLTPHTIVNWTYQDKGDKIHHNVFIGINRPIGIQQDFAQIYNNICFGIDQQGIMLTDHGSDRGVGQTAICLYNNTLKDNRVAINFGKGVYVKNPYVYWYNNIMDSPADGDNEYDMNIGDGYMLTTYAYDSARTHVENNYLFNPENYNQIMVTRNSGDCYNKMTLASFDACYSTTNWVGSGSDSDLYQGSSGASQYKTLKEHSIGTTNIATGGKGGNHPYLSGVTIPSYIGATNPDDNAWVDGVLNNLKSIEWMKNQSGDPEWIEGGEHNDKPAIPDNLRIID